MTPADRVAELRELIRDIYARYFADDSPEISDADYDLLVRELRQLEEQHPDLREPESPTAAVGTLMRFGAAIR